ncbi:MAG: radical SAM family heme chaperone HemW [Spirochaetes bacterium]|nr:radical SAM family heme chaperone HemW [Spirochaetota bacterium]MBP8991885.1 radical SAM family heme chaperone HemW [Spirochaetota bacterium]HOV46688.1 radical SAM family heme chaperone HemW [Exilispira sp.]HPB47021.1 radical SAM family heme chaperone HemW [Exilispira sp.]HQQ19615.1 radical SAM family heme chaperone HemW [Exilispira sp.]
MDDISIYIHLPFCKKKCYYCDFYSLPAGSLPETFIENYLLAVLLELLNYTDLLKSYRIKTIYIGGGTPNIIETSRLETFLELFFDILKKINPDFYDNIEEITIETNPEYISRNLIKMLKDEGINRISCGVQTISKRSAEILGRYISKNKIISSIEIITENFTNLSLDFMLGVPGHYIKDELKFIENLNYRFNSLKHISAYILMIPFGTPIYYKISEKQTENKSIKEYNYFNKFISQLGFKQYEISNYCKPGFESKHNLVYWNRQNYIGLGATASSYLYNVRYTNSCIAEYYQMFSDCINDRNLTLSNFKSLTEDLKNHTFNNRYLRNDSVANNFYKNLLVYIKKNNINHELLNKTQMMNEEIFLSLRKNEGLNLNSFFNEFEQDFLMDKKIEISRLQKMNDLIIERDNIKIPSEKFLIYNKIVGELLY